MIGLHDADSTGFPNLALMKLAAWFRSRGQAVEFYTPGRSYSKVFSSKVFTFSDEQPLPENAILGGVGRNVTRLPVEVEHLCPDYSLYGIEYSMGFLTRGCPNHCGHCVVPQNEGTLREHAEYQEFTRHKDVVFMDNNVLASEHGLRQIELLGDTKHRVDFNQGLDARRIGAPEAKLLSKLKWLSPLRLACDSTAMMKTVHKAVEILRWYNVSPRTYFCYVLVQDVAETAERVKFLKGIGVDPFAQPYRDRLNTPPTRLQRRFARWVNTRALFRSLTWEEYQQIQGDKI